MSSSCRCAKHLRLARALSIACKWASVIHAEALCNAFPIFYHEPETMAARATEGPEDWQSSEVLDELAVRKIVGHTQAHPQSH